MLLLRSTQPWISPRIHKFTKITPSKRDSMPFSCSWIHSSALCANNMFTNDGAKLEVSLLKISDKMGSLMTLDVLRKLEPNFLKVELKDYPQVNHTKIIICAVASYLLGRLLQQTNRKIVIVALQNLFSCLIQPFAVRSLPFACISNSLDKPTPLQLDVSFPSLHEIKWSFARLIYLFNIQLERNVATEPCWKITIGRADGFTMTTIWRYKIFVDCSQTLETQKPQGRLKTLYRSHGILLMWLQVFVLISRSSRQYAQSREDFKVQDCRDHHRTFFLLHAEEALS